MSSLTIRIELPTKEKKTIEYQIVTEGTRLPPEIDELVEILKACRDCRQDENIVVTCPKHGVLTLFAKELDTRLVYAYKNFLGHIYANLVMPPDKIMLLAYLREETGNLVLIEHENEKFAFDLSFCDTEEKCELLRETHEMLTLEAALLPKNSENTITYTLNTAETTYLRKVLTKVIK